MSKTIKRQRARARAPRGGSAVVKLSSSGLPTNETLWAGVEDSLLGLLDIEIDNSAIDLDHLCPQSVRLVVRLDLVRGNAHEKVERVFQRVMDALGVLCLAEDVYGQSEAFWTRLVLSHVMTSSPWDVDEDRIRIRDVVDFTRVHGLLVVLSWQDRGFCAYAADAIGVFLQQGCAKTNLETN